MIDRLTPPPLAEIASQNVTQTPSDRADIDTDSHNDSHVDTIQPHGALLVLHKPTLDILRVSANAEAILGIPPSELLALSLEDILGQEQTQVLRDRLREGSAGNAYMRVWLEKDGDILLRDAAKPSLYYAIFHNADERTAIVEFEPYHTESESMLRLRFQAMLEGAIARIQSATTLREVCYAVASEMRAITGFDRVLVYQFQPDGHGFVLAEAKGEEIPSCLGLYFPATDIPHRARQLYCTNGVRHIPNTTYDPVPLIASLPDTGDEPLDLSLATLRGVPSLHLQYLTNMGVAASLTVAIVKHEKLWGLIACYHRKARYLPYDTIAACKLLGQVMSMAIAAQEDNEKLAYRMQLKSYQMRLVEQAFASKDYEAELVADGEALLGLTGATGAAIALGERITTVGEVPRTDEIRALARWAMLQANHHHYCSANLPQSYPPAQTYKQAGSGVLIAYITYDPLHYIAWFRPALYETFDPAEIPCVAFPPAPGGSLSPSHSFAAWYRTTDSRSAAWQPVEIDGALALRHAIVELMLGRAKELETEIRHALEAQKELAEMRSQFITTVSHEFRTPLSVILAATEFLERNGDRASSEKKQKRFQRIKTAIQDMVALLDDVVFVGKSEAGKLELAPEVFDVEAFCRHLAEEIRIGHGHDGTIEVVIVQTTPDLYRHACLDRKLLRQILSNLLSNALKYSPPPRKVRFELDSAIAETGTPTFIFRVRDWGIGIPPEDRERLFESFYRGKNVGAIAGTGLGLKIVRDCVQAHGGTIDFESTLGKGTIFTVTLPAR